MEIFFTISIKEKNTNLLLIVQKVKIYIPIVVISFNYYYGRPFI